MNLDQKALSAITLGAFVASLIWAPWLVIPADLPMGRLLLPIWTVPGTFIDTPAMSGRLSLDMRLLIIEWVVLAVAYFALFKFLAPKPRA